MAGVEYVGTIQGDFSVNAGGGAVYSIPLAVPPGTAGLAPGLTVVYGSGAGNGLLGMGWSLQGLSAITRTGATVAQDGFIGAVEYGPRDRFVLDGQRLMAVEGEYGAENAVYHTETESWKKVVPVYSGTVPGRSGPDAFRVTARNGWLYEYGTTPDARVPASVGNPSVRVWALNRVTDLNGNYLTLGYRQDPGSGAYYPLGIDYTGNAGVDPRRAVRFAWEDRPDPFTFYLGGYAVRATQRLAAVQTLLDGAPVMSYEFAYRQGQSTGRSQLVSVTQADAAGKALPPTTFDWQDGSDGFFQPARAQPAAGIAAGATLLPMDVNGDGLVDFVSASPGPGGALQMTLYLAAPDGMGLQPGVPVPGAGLRFGGTFLPMDVDGDGCIDLVYGVNDGGQLGLTVFFARPGAGGGWTLEPGPVNAVGPAGLSWGGALHALDVNGDGKTDLVYVVNDGGTLGLRTLFSNGATFSPSPDDRTAPTVPFGGQVLSVDVNGDGMTDLVYATRDGAELGLVLFLSQGKEGFAQQGPSVLPPGTTLPYGGQLLPMDVNADGNVDLVYAFNSGGRLALRTLLADGGRGFDPQPVQETGLAFGGYLMPMEVNGDGRTDLVVASPADTAVSLAVLLSTGGGFAAQTGVSQSLAGARWGGVLLPLDLDGSGKTDLLYATPSGGDALLTRVLAAGPQPDLVTAVTNGLGGRITVEYLPLTRPEVYRRGGPSDSQSLETQGLINNAISGSVWALAPGGGATPGAVYATRLVDFPHYVAAAYTRGDGRGGVYRHTYFYTAARVDLTGHGWLGFASVQATDADAGSRTDTEYNQPFPLTFTPAASAVTRVADGAWMSASAWKYQARQTAGGVYQVLPATVRQEQYNFDPPGSPPGAVQTRAYDYDAYGNATLTAATASGVEALPLYTFQTWQNDPGLWRLGYPVERRLAADAGGQEVLLWEQMEYDPTTWNLALSRVWDPGQQRWLPTARGYDRFGNEIRVTPPSGAVINTEYDPDYHTFPTLTLSPPTEAGLTLATAAEFSAAFGTQTVTTLPRVLPDSGPNPVLQVVSLDGLGQVAETRGPDPAGALVALTTQAWAHDGTGPYRETRTRQDWGGEAWSWQREYVDGFGRTWRTAVLGPDGVTPVFTDRELDGRGRVVRESVPYYEGSEPVWTTRVYDAYGRLVEEVMPADGGGTSVTRVEYSSVAEVVETQAAGTPIARRTTEVNGIVNGRSVPVARTAADGGTSTFTYDARGRVLATTDPNGIVTRSTYDPLDRQLTLSVSVPDQAPSPVLFAYDDVRRRVTYTDQAGTVTLLAYDALGRLASRTVAGSETTLQYDAPNQANGAGRLAAVLMPGGVHYDFSYDAYGNPAKSTVALEGGAYTTVREFTPTAQVLRLTFPDGTTQHNAYNAAGHLIGLGDGTASAAYDGFSALGRPGRAALGNGTTASYGFNPIGQLIAQALSGPDGAALAGARYAWNELNAVSRIDDAEPAHSQTFAYDPTGRLARTIGGYGTRNFGYDRAGNLVLKDGISFTYDGYRVTGGMRDGEPVFSATYDEVGGMVRAIREGVPAEYAYDVEGRLVRAGGGAFTYDYTGRRLTKRAADGTLTLYVTPAYEVVLLDGGRAQHTRYLAGPYGLVASVTVADAGGGNAGGTAGVPVPGTFYFHQDRLGSTAVQTDARGGVVSTVRYLPYGGIYDLTGPDGFRQKFTGKELDGGSGLYYFAARYYDPWLGRFLTADTTLGGPIDQRDVFNRYAYALNDPANYIDPTGHSIWDLLGAIAIGLGLVAAGVYVTVKSGGSAGTTVGAALIGAGIGAIADAAQKGEDFSFKNDWQEWLTTVGTGALAGLVAGGAGAAGSKIVATRYAATRSADWAPGGGKRWGTNVLFGVIGGAASGAVGQAASNAAEHKPIGQGVAVAAGIGAGLGAAGGVISEDVAFARSRWLTPDERISAERAINGGWYGRLMGDAPAATAFGPVLEPHWFNNLLMTAPGTLFTALDAGIYARYPDLGSGA